MPLANPFDHHPIQVERMESVAIGKDGRRIAALFQCGGSGRTALEFDTLELSGFLNDLAGAVQAARQRDTRLAQDVVPAEQPTAVRVGLAEGNHEVLMTFRMPNGLEHHFVFEPKAARELHTNIGAALSQRKSPTAH
jgi:hypothetical protein